MFFYLDYKIQWDFEESIPAFVDHILFRARYIQDIKTVFEAFYGPARDLDLNMNTNKIQLHAMRGSAQTVIGSRHRSAIATWDAANNPRKVYKYLGVYFYTEDKCQKVLDFAKSEINSFFAHFAPLGLTATEVIMLCNRQS